MQLQLDTKSSMAISRVVQQTNYSALSSLPRTLINQINSEGEIYLTATTRCAKLWKEFRKQDFTSVQIPFKVAEQIYTRNMDDFTKLLKLQNAKDFFEVFDQDNDGFLNEDEQILVFSVIKEKMSQVANQLLQIQQYFQFKQLMIQIRLLETNINVYQNELRSKIHTEEVKTYQEIGVEKLDDFCEKYYNAFQQFEQNRQNRMEAQILSQNDEMAKLNEGLRKDTHLLKVKPKRKLKDLQTQEKLVSLDERVEEALDFRRELKNMEKSEQERVAQEQWKRMDTERKDLQRCHQKQIDQLTLKLTETEHKLMIQMKRDYNVLLKQIGLHNNEINRIHSQSNQNAIQKGDEVGELKRIKQRARIQNFIIGDSKKTNTRPDTAMEMKLANISPRSPQGSSHQSKNEKVLQELKGIIHGNNLTQFYIKKKYGADLPVNFKSEPYNTQRDTHGRIEKILSNKKKSPHDILPSLTELYDGGLNPVSFGVTQKSEQDLVQERLHRKQYIMEKLQDN